MKGILIAAPLVALAFLPAFADANGDMWEVTSQMSIPGMPPGMGMPAQTLRVCTGHEWTKPPMGGEEHGCKTTDFQSTATKTSWKMTCPDGDGEGEITRSTPDAYTGVIKMSMGGNAVTMNISGKRVGDCDAGEAKKEREAQVAGVKAQIAASEKAAAESKDQSCMSVAASGDLQQFNYQAEICKDPKYKVAYCDSLKKCDVFKKLVQRDESDPANGLHAAAKFCGVDPDGLVLNCCDDAVERKDVAFVAAHCPDKAKAFALENCTGMGYSALQGEPWKSFCTTYAKEVMGKGANAPPKRTGKSSR